MYRLEIIDMEKDIAMPPEMGIIFEFEKLEDVCNIVKNLMEKEARINIYKICELSEVE